MEFKTNHDFLTKVSKSILVDLENYCNKPENGNLYGFLSFIVINENGFKFKMGDEIFLLVPKINSYVSIIQFQAYNIWDDYEGESFKKYTRMPNMDIYYKHSGLYKFPFTNGPIVNPPHQYFNGILTILITEAQKLDEKFNQMK